MAPRRPAALKHHHRLHRPNPHKNPMLRISSYLITLLIVLLAHPPLQGVSASWSLVLLGEPQASPPSYSKFSKFLSHYTSVTMPDQPEYISAELTDLTHLYRQPWLFVQDIAAIRLTSPLSSRALRPQFVRWLRHGGTLILAGAAGGAELKQLTQAAGLHHGGAGRWQPMGADHELLRSFYLLTGLPACKDHRWQEFRLGGRMAILHAPAGFITAPADTPATQGCFSKLAERSTYRLMVNLIMVILTTNYKQDQIHIREILKRIR